MDPFRVDRSVCHFTSQLTLRVPELHVFGRPDVGRAMNRWIGIGKIDQNDRTSQSEECPKRNTIWLYIDIDIKYEYNYMLILFKKHWSDLSFSAKANIDESILFVEWKLECQHCFAGVSSQVFAIKHQRNKSFNPDHPFFLKHFCSIFFTDGPVGNTNGPMVLAP